MTIMLNGSDLTVTQVVAAARHGEAVALAPAAIAAMRQARTVVEEVLSTGEPVYGLTPAAEPCSSSWHHPPIACPHAGAKPGADRCELQS